VALLRQCLREVRNALGKPGGEDLQWTEAVPKKQVAGQDSTAIQETRFAFDQQYLKVHSMLEHEVC
jgi:hypothetical protein